MEPRPRCALNKCTAAISFCILDEKIDRSGFSAFQYKFCEMIRNRWRTSCGCFKKENRVTKAPREVHSVSETVLQARKHASECMAVEQQAREQLFSAIPKHDPPPVPKYSRRGSRQKKAAQFRFGHVAYWKENALEIPQVF